jgi:ABC-type uncharacterized transport system permease subunit
MTLLMQYTLIFASVLILVALGGCFSEHSGVINLGLEGIMVMGSLGGALALKYMPAGSSNFAMILVVVLSAIVVGMLYASLLAVACINFKADQTLVGTALNLLGTAAATVIVKAINSAENPDNVSATIQYVNAKKAFLVNIGSFEFNWFMLMALIALIICLRHPVQDPLRSASHGLRRTPPGGGQRGHQRLQDALGRRAHLRLAGRSGRHRLHHRRRQRMEI